MRKKLITRIVNEYEHCEIAPEFNYELIRKALFTVLKLSKSHTILIKKNSIKLRQYHSPRLDANVEIYSERVLEPDTHNMITSWYKVVQNCEINERNI